MSQIKANTQAVKTLIERLKSSVSALNSSVSIMEEEISHASSSWSDTNFTICQSLVRRYTSACRESIPILESSQKRLESIVNYIEEYNS